MTVLNVYRPALVAYDSLIKYRERHPELNLTSRMDSIWKNTLKTHNIYADVYSRPVLEDIKNISSAYLTTNIDKAYESWRNNPYSDSISFADFCEYLLPYRRQQGLCLEEWRNKFFNDNFCYAREKYPMPIQRLVDSLLFKYTNFIHTYEIMSDYPYLKLTDFYIAKRGECGTKCWFNSMLFASLGIPVAIDFVPSWGNRNDKHQWNVLVYNGKTYPFESFWEEDKWKYKKLYNNMSSDPLYGDFRLAKVFRYSYQTDRTGPANDINVSNNDIPPLFLNTKKKDVSSEYFETSDVEISLINLPRDIRYAYLCVFSSHNIIPVQWGKIKSNRAIFKNMGRDVVYVPAYYKDGMLIPSGQAFHLDYSGQKKYFEPTGSKISITIKRKYPVFPFKKEWAESLVGGKFQGANRADFGKAVDLYTIKEPPDFIPQNKDIHSPNTYRYARFIFAKGKYGNLAEIKFYSASDNQMIALDGNPVYSDELIPDVMSKALDNNISTFILPYMPGRTSRFPWWVGLDFGKPKKITTIGFCPRTDENNVMIGLNYELQYWDNGWISLGEQNAAANELNYKNVPANALFILKCTDKGREERIFTIENGKQVWR